MSGEAGAAGDHLLRLPGDPGPRLASPGPGGVDPLRMRVGSGHRPHAGHGNPSPRGARGGRGHVVPLRLRRLAGTGEQEQPVVLQSLLEPPGGALGRPGAGALDRGRRRGGGGVALRGARSPGVLGRRRGTPGGLPESGLPPLSGPLRADPRPGRLPRLPQVPRLVRDVSRARPNRPPVHRARGRPGYDVGRPPPPQCSGRGRRLEDPPGAVSGGSGVPLGPRSAGVARAAGRRAPAGRARSARRWTPWLGAWRSV